MVRKGRRWTYALMAAMCGVAVLVYPFAMKLFTDKPDALAAHMPFAILMAGVVVAAGWLPFGQTLLMAGRPGWHTGLMALTVLTNVVGNWLLIPDARVGLGMNGAAIATAISLAASVVYLRFFVRRQVGVSL